MRRQQWIRAAVVGLLAAAAGAVAAPVPAAAADIFVEVTPSTVEAGQEVAIRASCDRNDAAATVESDAFGSVTVEPAHGFLTATVRVPAATAARRHTVRLTCPSGRMAETTLHVVGSVRPSRGPATGFGGAAGPSTATMLITGGLLAMAAALGVGLLGWRRRAVR